MPLAVPPKIYVHPPRRSAPATASADGALKAYVSLALHSVHGSLQHVAVTPNVARSACDT